MIVYDFGAGYVKVPGRIRVDIDPKTQPDLVSDIRGSTLKADTADEIWCVSVLEHFTHPGHLLALKEIIRVLKPGGTFTVIVPHPSSDAAHVPGHAQVLPPHYWRMLQANPAGYVCPGFVIDEIVERDNPAAVAVAERLGLSAEQAREFLRNAAIDTVVKGHKEAQK